MNRNRNPYLIAWIIFTLLGTVGGNIVALFAAHSILAFFDKAGVSEHLMWWIRVTVHFVVALSISYAVFDYVMRKRFTEKTSADTTRTI